MPAFVAAKRGWIAYGKEEYIMEQLEKKKMYDVTVIGMGPAGLAALVYLLEAHLNVIAIGPEVGGQSDNTPEITNWPFIPTLSGKEFQEGMIGFFENLQAKFPEYLYTVKGLIVSTAEATGKMFKVTAQTIDGEMVFFTKAIIIATGAKRKNLPVPGAEELKGKGIAFCGTCDAPFFKDDTVAVIGGGNTALENILTLMKYAGEVIAVIVTDDFTGNPDLRQRVTNLPNVKIIRNTEVLEVIGSTKVTGIKLRDMKTGNEWEEKVDGVFPSIGATVNSQPFSDLVETNKLGEITVGVLGETSANGVWAIGDVTNVPFKQIGIATGQGITAALSAIGYVESLPSTSPCEECAEGSPSLKEKILTRQKQEEEFTYPDVTDEQFFQEVLTRAGETLLMVRIEGCGDCKAARPHFLKAQKRFPSMNFITIEWEKNPEVMAWLNEHEKVRAAPTFVKISSGREIDRRVDMQRPKEMIEALTF
ncbi:MAG: FAD-dependent oxidoreductase [Deltaproteobacteria bacterium]|nr:FAD-dependent oxidoreductase [Deltaproteobacteria bacterium]